MLRSDGMNWNGRQGASPWQRLPTRPPEGRGNERLDPDEPALKQHQKWGAGRNKSITGHQRQQQQQQQEKEEGEEEGEEEEEGEKRVANH